MEKEKGSKVPDWLSVEYVTSLSPYVFTILELTRHISGIVREQIAKKQRIEFLLANPRKVDTSSWTGSPLDSLFVVRSELVNMRKSLSDITDQLELCEDILLVLQIAKNYSISLDYDIVGPLATAPYPLRHGFLPPAVALWREYILKTHAHGNLHVPRIIKAAQRNGLVIQGFKFSLGNLLGHTRQFTSLLDADTLLGDLTTGQHVISRIEASGGLLPYLPPQMQPMFKSSEQPAAPART